MIRRRQGFTLIEVVVALALTGAVVLMARRIVAALTDGATRVTQTRAAMEQHANGRRLLAILVGSAQVGEGPGEFFDGRPDGVTFSTWGGGQRRPPVPLRIALAADSQLTLAGLGADLVLEDSVASLGVDYLLDTGVEARWVRVWRSTVSLPVALRMRISRVDRADTLLLLIGPRG